MLRVGVVKKLNVELVLADLCRVFVLVVELVPNIDAVGVGT